jgi:plastocyanin
LLPVFASVLLAGAGSSTASSSMASSSTIVRSKLSATARAAAASVVTLHDIQFHPSVVHIKVGGRVMWKWEDADIETPHNVTSIGSKHFKSSTTKMSGTYTVVFNTAGVYKFECSIHPLSMQGRVIVK